MWMVFGPAGGPAPYYGCTFTRKELKEAFPILPTGCKYTRVLVIPVPDWLAYESRVRPRP